MSNTKLWLKDYPKNVPANIDPDTYPSVVTMLDEVFVKFAARPAFVFMGRSMSFSELDQYSKQFGAYLHSRGLEPGDKIVLMMPNLLQYPIALFGALRAGLVIVNTNPLYTPREMRHQFKDSGAKAIVIAENFASNLQQILHETDIKVVITTSIGEMLGLKGIVVNFMVRRVKKMVPAFSIANTIGFMDALSQGAKFTIKPHLSNPDDVIALQYTGGTTGPSKGAMLTNRNLVANMLQIRAFMFTNLKEGVEVALCALPMYHIFAFSVNCLGLLSAGTLNVMIVNARDIPSVVAAFKKYPLSVVTGVNTLYNAILNNEAFAKCDFSNLKVSVGGGMAVQRAVAERWQQVTNCPLTEGFGMTESSPVASCNPIDGSGKIGSIGVPVPSTEMRVCDDDGNPVALGEIGEIQIKGPQVMKGYFNRPDATDEAIKDGWLLTGDIGVMDEDGYFKIVDRKKDMILVSGFNVYPNEVEEVLGLHPKVLESAAIGVPDEKSTEAVKVFVVKRDSSLTEAELIEHCRKNMTGYKVPKYVEFRTDLPKTNVGKILRRELRDK